MDSMMAVKAGFMGFALSMGVLMLAFFVLGRFVTVSAESFVRLFVVAGLASFLAIDVFLYYKIRVEQLSHSEFFLVACLGGWLGGIFSGLTNMKKLLISIGSRGTPAS